jgi:hypothetical protein
LPKSFKAKESLNTSKRQIDDLPRADDPFVIGCTWAEFKTEAIPRNPAQVKIDFSKEDQIWFYLGKTSTEARAQFTEDLGKPRHNPKGHFLDTIPKPISATPRQSYAASYPSGHGQNGFNSKASSRPPQVANPAKQEKPYIYKPRISDDAYRIDPQAYRSQQTFLQHSTSAPLSFGTDPRWKVSSESTPATTSCSPTSSYSPAGSFPRYSTPLNSTNSTPQPTGVLAPPVYFKHSYGTPVPPPKQNNAYSGKAISSKPNPFAKYKYLQKEHNRSPLEYKSPYRPGGGFMNGYQGSLEKHLQQTLFNGRAPATTSLTSNQPQFTSYGSATATSGSSVVANTPKQVALLPQQVTKSTVHNTWNNKEPALHPAIRQEYSAMFHKQYQHPPHPTPDQASQYPLHQVQYDRQQQMQQAARTTQFQQSVKSHQSAQPPPLPPSTQTRPNSDVRQDVNFQPSKPQTQIPSNVSHSGANSLYPHQQCLQTSYSQDNAASLSLQSWSHIQNRSGLQDQTPAQRELPDVPADSTSLVEKMMMNLRKVTTSASPVG